MSWPLVKRIRDRQGQWREMNKAKLKLRTTEHYGNIKREIRKKNMQNKQKYKRRQEERMEIKQWCELVLFQLLSENTENTKSWMFPQCSRSSSYMTYSSLKKYLPESRFSFLHIFHTYTFQIIKQMLKLYRDNTSK